jgi:hypothetical protein
MGHPFSLSNRYERIQSSLRDSFGFYAVPALKRRAIGRRSSGALRLGLSQFVTGVAGTFSPVHAVAIGVFGAVGLGTGIE